MPRRRSCRRAALWLTITALVGCAGPRRLSSTRPIEEWVTATPDEVGMNAALLRGAAEDLAD